MSSRFPDGVDRRMLTLAVACRIQLSPNLARVTLSGDALSDFVPQGGDQCCRLFFPRPAQEGLWMPSIGNDAWALQYLWHAAARRAHPLVRNMTVRAFRPPSSELDIDVVLHEDTPLSRWVRSVETGSPAGIFDEGRTYRLRADTDWQLLVADESGMPAALAIAEEAPPEMATTVYLEVPTDADVLDADLGEHVTVIWLPRNNPERIPGQLALQTVLATPLPAVPGSVFVAGERGLATGLRRGLVAAGVPKSSITFTGYWRHGAASLG